MAFFSQPIAQPKSLAPVLDRRAFLKAGLGIGALAALQGIMPRAAFAALAQQPLRQLALSNLHTGESCCVQYWQNGAYVPEALATIRRVLRDHRTNEEHAIDPALLDLLSVLHAKLETDAPYQIISGYRSPASNRAMHAHSAGVASHSLHTLGKATDIRIAGRGLALVHATALAMGLGGVGYYPDSDFVHVDTGRVRQWQG